MSHIASINRAGLNNIIGPTTASRKFELDTGEHPPFAAHCQGVANTPAALISTEPVPIKNIRPETQTLLDTFRAEYGPGTIGAPVAKVWKSDGEHQTAVPRALDNGREKAANKIKQCFNQFKQVKRTTPDNERALGRFVKRIVLINKDGTGPAPTPYYGDIEGKLPPTFDPRTLSAADSLPGEATQAVLKGGDKVPIASDRRMVAFAPSYGRSHFLNTTNLNAGAEILTRLGLKSFAPAIQVADNVMLARNAGTQLRERINNHNPVKLGCFKPVIEDLATLHNIGKRHIMDISPENLVYDDGRKKLSLVDCDSLVDAAYFDADFGYRLPYRPHSLTNAYGTAKTIAEREKVCNATDCYALILTMALSTRHNKQSRSFWSVGKIFAKYKLTRALRANRVSYLNHNRKAYIDQVIPETQADQYAKLLANWIDTHVKPGHKNTVAAFMCDPLKHYDKLGGMGGMQRMLRFDADSHSAT